MHIICIENIVRLCSLNYIVRVNMKSANLEMTSHDLMPTSRILLTHPSISSVLQFQMAWRAVLPLKGFHLFDSVCVLCIGIFYIFVDIVPAFITVFTFC